MDLRLIITKGPREGETLEFPPRSSVRIGRIARGNNLVIKDSGISSKHLAIDCASGKWVLRDLDSSNGTFVNGELVDPSETVEVHSGDVLKLGEQTSMSVEIAVGEPAPVPLESGLRRGRPRRAKASNLIAEEEELPEVPIVEQKAVRMKLGVAQKRARDSVEADLQPGKKATTRQTRRTKKESAASVPALVIIPEDSELDIGNGKAQSCTQGRKKLQQNPPEFVFAAIEEGTEEEAAREIKGEIENPSGVKESPDAAEKAGTSGLKDSSELVKKRYDLKTMTLGEWFDFLKVYLRKQIMDETEAMIEEMCMKAKRIREYAAEQKKLKAEASGV